MLLRGLCVAAAAALAAGVPMIAPPANVASITPSAGSGESTAESGVVCVWRGAWGLAGDQLPRFFRCRYPLLPPSPLPNPLPPSPSPPPFPSPAVYGGNQLTIRGSGFNRGGVQVSDPWHLPSRLVGRRPGCLLTGRQRFPPCNPPFHPPPAPSPPPPPSTFAG
jgi:hypothetical protein